MGRHYTTKDFFRQVPNELLARYFRARELFRDLDFAALKETKPDALFTEWLDLPEEMRHAMDAEFAEIFGMSCEKGWVAIRDEAQWSLRKNPEVLDAFIGAHAALPSHCHRAMVTFLDHPKLWRGATRFFHADSLVHWRKRKNMGHIQADTDDLSIRLLADGLKTYFRLTEGRGDNCIVETLRRGELDYFFAYPEDYSQQSNEWVDGQFAPRPHTPAFEVIYVYSQKDGTLDVNFRGNKKALQAVQAIFAENILKLEGLPPDPKDDRVYDLSSLLDRDFAFSFPATSGIESVAVKKIRLASRVYPGDRITLETDTKRDPWGIHGQLGRLRRTLEFDHYEVTQVELVVVVQVDIDKAAKAFPVRITHPNSCSLKYDEMGLKLRAMLEASGIEPKEPEAEPCVTA